MSWSAIPGELLLSVHGKLTLVTFRMLITRPLQCLTESKPAVDGSASVRKHPDGDRHVGGGRGGEGSLVERARLPDLVHASQGTQGVGDVVGAVGEGREGGGYNLRAGVEG